ncbi:hypothetical protein CAPN004_11550 [Capnocytophaga cynodegmi]|nr:hypothetical protein CAPN004_11550 [Capnocytophaga cynodegmi]
MVELSYIDQVTIDGGCHKCRNAGKRIGRSIQDFSITEALESAWEGIKSWFD